MKAKELTIITNDDQTHYLVSDGVVSNAILVTIADLIKWHGGDPMGVDGEEGIEFYYDDMDMDEFKKTVENTWGVDVIDKTETKSTN